MKNHPKAYAPILTRMTVLTAAFYCLFITACSKHNDTNPNKSTTADTAGTMGVNLTYNDNGFGGDSMEVIISEPGGKILLDTLAKFLTPVVTRLKTTQPLLNVTTVIQDPSTGVYRVMMTRSANPSKWVNLMFEDYWYDTTLAESAANIYYKNAPAYTGSPYFGNCIRGGGYKVTPSGSNINVSYQRANTQVYLLLPSLGLYTIHQPIGALDTVDLSSMSTAVKQNITIPSEYTWGGVSQLLGVPDSTNLAKSFFVFDGTATADAHCDVEYPSGMQKYEMLYTAYSSTSSTYSYSYSSTIPTSLALPTSASYTLNATQSSNFSVQFNNINPTTYYTTWKSANLQFWMYVPGDSTTINPMAMLSAMNSKMLAGKDLGTPTIQYFGIIIGPAGMDNAGYWSYMNNPGMVSSVRLPSLTNYERSVF